MRRWIDDSADPEIRNRDLTSVLPCLVTIPTTPEDIRMKAQAKDLLTEIESGSMKAAIGEVVLHEFCYVSGSKRLDRLDVPTLCDLLRSLLSWPGWVIPPSDKSAYRRASDILEQHPKLEFSDSVIAARAEALNAELATFDSSLAKAHEGPAWV